MTIHHSKYYSTGTEPPADWDDPIIVPFLAATGTFLVALSGPAKWVDAAFLILEHALRAEGIGAKTSAGYGRLTLLSVAESAQATPAAGGAPLAPAGGYELTRKQLLAETPPAGRLRGTLAKIGDTYGFINPAGGGAEVFVHQSEVKASKLRVGQVLEYTLGPGRRPGQIAAHAVNVLLEPPT
jgi:cold shock CspA family protein